MSVKQKILSLLEKKHKMGFRNNKYDNLHKEFEFVSRSSNEHNMQNILLKIMETSFESVKKHCLQDLHGTYVGKLSNEDCRNKKGKSSVELYNACYDLLRSIGYKNAQKKLEEQRTKNEKRMQNTQNQLRKRAQNTGLNLGEEEINQLGETEMNEIIQLLSIIQVLKITYPIRFKKSKQELYELTKRLLYGIINDGYKLSDGNANTLTSIIERELNNKLVVNEGFVYVNKSDPEIAKLIESLKRKVARYSRLKPSKRKRFFKEFLGKLERGEDVKLGELMDVMLDSRDKNTSWWKSVMLDICYVAEREGRKGNKTVAHKCGSMEVFLNNKRYRQKINQKIATQVKMEEQKKRLQKMMRSVYRGEKRERRQREASKRKRKEMERKVVGFFETIFGV